MYKCLINETYEWSLLFNILPFLVVLASTVSMSTHASFLTTFTILSVLLVSGVFPHPRVDHLDITARLNVSRGFEGLVNNVGLLFEVLCLFLLV